MKKELSSVSVEEEVALVEVAMVKATRSCVMWWWRISPIVVKNLSNASDSRESEKDGDPKKKKKQ